MRTIVSAIAALAAGSLPLAAAMTISFTPNLPSPRPVGTPVTWTTTVSDTSPGDHQYRFAVSPRNGTPRIWRDFGNPNTWTWAFTSFEGLFNLTVTVRNTTTGEIASRTVPYELVSRLTSAGYATVSQTAHPLVALFSGVACKVPNLMRVRFVRVGEASSRTTNSVPCRVVEGASAPDFTSMNFLVAGMYASSTYLMNWETVTPAGATVTVGSQLSFQTGSIPGTVPISPFTIIVPPPSANDPQPILLQSFQFRSMPFYANAAIDLNGNVLWYHYEPDSFILRTLANGNLTVIKRGGPSSEKLLREIDLAGNVLAETNAGRVSEQLVARGLPRIVGFSHEVRRISNPGKSNNGFIAVLGTTDIVSTQHQGGTPQNPVDIIGDEVIVLDHNLQVNWAWNPFVNFDLSREAVLGEKCTATTTCRPLTPGFQVANDWMHTNTIYYSPWDGNFVLSLRSQDWLIKINYADGAGDGRVVWRLGAGGDFSITTNNTHGAHDLGSPWFSHQHDSEFEFGGGLVNGVRILTVFDNGNTRKVRFNRNARSRCQLYAVNEAAREVNLNRNADLGTYSAALSSAQFLDNGSLSCNSGQIGSTSQTVESNLGDSRVYVIQWLGSTYRTFRMRDMYSPPTP